MIIDGETLISSTFSVAKNKELQVASNEIMTVNILFFQGSSLL